jgi:ribonuclease Z
MQAAILGCGEAFDERFPNTSVLVRAGAAMLLDCGYSVPAQVWKHAPGADAIDLVYISHVHADHYFGLAPLLGRMWEDGRRKPLTIVSQPAVIGQLHELLEFGYRGLAARFEYPIEYIAAVPGASVEAAGAVFDFAETLHSVRNLAVRIRAGGKTVCYGGDGMFTGESRDLFASADLLVHEAYFFDQSPVHADIGRLLEMAKEQHVRRTALVHVQRDLRRDVARIEQAIAAAGIDARMPEPLATYEL